MNKVGAVLVGWVIVLGVQEDHSEEEVKKILPPARDIEKVKLRLTEKQIEILEKALGATLEGPEVIYHKAKAELMFPKQGTFGVRTTVVRVEGTRGPIRLGIAILPKENRLVSVVVLKASKGEVELANSAFLRQLDGFDYSEDALFRSREELAKLREKAKAGDDEESRRYRALITVMRSMKRVPRLFGEIRKAIRSESKAGSETAKALKGEFQKLVDAAPDSLFLTDRDRKLFETVGRTAADLAGSVEKLIADGDFSGAGRIMQQMGRRSCSACHGSFQERFHKEREASGLGNGYFADGFDIDGTDALPDPIERRVATAVRKGVLLLESVDRSE